MILERFVQESHGFVSRFVIMLPGPAAKGNAMVIEVLGHSASVMSVTDEFSHTWICASDDFRGRNIWYVPDIQVKDTPVLITIDLEWMDVIAAAVAELDGMNNTNDVDRLFDGAGGRRMVADLVNRRKNELESYLC